MALPVSIVNLSNAQHGALEDRITVPRFAFVQHGPDALNFDDVGDTWPARDVEHGAAYEDVDPRGYVS
jgi:hypothetical protein